MLIQLVWIRMDSEEGSEAQIFVLSFGCGSRDVFGGKHISQLHSSVNFYIHYILFLDYVQEGVQHCDRVRIAPVSTKRRT